MNQTIKSNIPLMIFFSILIFGLMTAIAAGALNKVENGFVMFPFAVFFFCCGIMPFFSWKRAFSRSMTFTPKGIEFQLCPGKVIFLPWSDIQAVGMGANATVYLKDMDLLNGRCELCIFTSADQEWNTESQATAIRLLLQKAFDEYGIFKVYSYVFAANEDEVELLSNAGFSREALLKGEAQDARGEHVDVYRMCIFRKEFLKD